jgi:formylglycine-generating enzyme required for sulfatase activity
LPVERKYRSNAERQAAYRDRHPEKRLPTEAELAILARSLHVVLVKAAEAGTSPLPSAWIGDRADRTLRNLIRFLDPHPDGIRGTG